MIKRLRHKFIMISMISVILVLTVIVSIINIANYREWNEKADEMMEMLAANGGRFERPNKQQFGPKPPIEPKWLSEESPYETRFFMVLLGQDGHVQKIDTNFIAAITPEDAAAYAVDIFQSGKKNGFFHIYKYLLTPYDDGYMVIFLDCGRDMSIFYAFLRSSIIVSAIGVLSIFILLVFFSKIAVGPIAQSYERQKQFITDASHEIKTPLTVIDANTEVLEMEYGENEWTISIKNQIKRLVDLTHNLVALARMDEEDNRMEKTEFSLSDAVTEAAEPFQTLAKAQDKRIVLRVETNLSYCGNEKQLRQLVAIFMDNAMKYANREADITVVLRKQGKKYELSVSNESDQIPAGNLNLIFERFYRGDSSRNSRISGYGIGLSIAKHIVEAHGGRISAKSTDGKVFTITAVLP